MIGLNEGSIPLPRLLAKAEVNSHSKKIVSSKASNRLHFFNAQCQELNCKQCIRCTKRENQLAKSKQKIYTRKSSLETQISELSVMNLKIIDICSRLILICLKFRN